MLLSRVRTGILAAMALWLTPVLAVGAEGFGLPLAVAIQLGACMGVGVATVASRALHAALGRHLGEGRVIRLAAGVAALAAVFQIASLSVFMSDVDRVRFSGAPDDPFRVRHSCMSSYAEAARFADDGLLNIYDVTLYQPRAIGPLNVDPYHYPPPFLLLPEAVRAMAPDFWNFRRLWFAMQALVLAGVLVGAASWLGGPPAPQHSWAG